MTVAGLPHRKIFTVLGSGTCPAAQDFWAVSVNMDTRLSSSAPVDAVTDRAGAHNWPAMVLKVVLRLVPTKGERRNRCDRDQRDNQRVLDRRDARLIVDEL